jgi:hypothetical protein
LVDKEEFSEWAQQVQASHCFKQLIEDEEGELKREERDAVGIEGAHHQRHHDLLIEGLGEEWLADGGEIFPEAGLVVDEMDNILALRLFRGQQVLVEVLQLIPQQSAHAEAPTVYFLFHEG